LKKSDLILPLTRLAAAVFMLAFISAGFLIIQTNANLPNAQNIKNVRLKVPLRVYSADGLLISEFGNERRKPIAIEYFPQGLIDAVLASEDDNFYDHRGIDISGLFRAAISNFRSGATQQGASTITMQVARNFFLSREKTYARKLNEVLLAIKLEQILSKDQILALYLNKIFLGHRAYGFGAAADVYYGRELNDLSLAEIAMLAGLPKAPSSNNPLRNEFRALNRRNYVLNRLLNLDKISEERYLKAKAAPITAEKHGKESGLEAPHIAEMVRAELIEQYGEEVYWQGLDVYTTILAKEQNAAASSLREGLQAYDRRHGFRGPIARLEAELSELNRVNTDNNLENENDDIGLRYTELLSEFPNSQEQVPALVTETSEQTAILQTKNFGQVELLLDDSKWARRHLTANKLGDRPTSMAELLKVADVVYIQPILSEKEPTGLIDELAEVEPIKWRLSQIPNIGGALISIEPRSGRILSLVGGYDFFLNKYNRAVQSIRQPGSNIKPFIYSASLDKGFTPATLISGGPIVMTDAAHGTLWRPENYSGKFFGPTRIREALSKSLNLVSIRLLRSIGIPYAREYLERFGINMNRFSSTLTMALGSGGITPLEMVGAYGVLANTGYRVEPYFIDYIANRDGEIIYRAKQVNLCDECYQQYLEVDEELEVEVVEQIDETTNEVINELTAEEIIIDNELIETENPQPESELGFVQEIYDAPRVMSEANNYLTVSMLKDVVRRGTARKALALERQDLAGKTGTTNDYIDAWFTGFNSQLATTVWIGFDEPTTLGKGEAGSVAALPIWVNYMRTALEGIEQDTQEVPYFMEEGFVNRNTGERTDEFDPDAVIEYFPIEELLPNTFGELSEIEEHNLEYDDLFDAESEISPEDEIEEAPIEPRIIEEEEDTEGLF